MFDLSEGGENQKFVLKEVKELYHQGLYLQAYQAGMSLGEPWEWTGAEGRMLGSRLLYFLGSPRKSLWQVLKAHKESPDEGEVRYGYAYQLLEHQGPWHGWRHLQKEPELVTEDRELLSAWYALHAQVLIRLRDFERGEKWLKQALSTCPESAWVRVIQSDFYTEQDDYESALRVVEEGLEHRPWHRASVQSRAHLLTLLNRDEEAFAYLVAASQKLECSTLYWQILQIYQEKEEYKAVDECLVKYMDLSPLMERGVKAAVKRIRALIGYHLGDIQGAINAALETKDEVFIKYARRLEDPVRQQGKRVNLAVGFTRQHQLTCVPATLATIANYWNQPADHLQIAEEICYNGTSNYNERKWAESHGWYVREFACTEENVKTIIDAGIPCSLTTIDASSSHMQAIIGYDERRGSIMIRDPYLKHRYEIFIEQLMENYAPFGPRCMAMIPFAQREQLELLNLPGSDLWEMLHQFDGALEKHQRDEALRILQEMQIVDQGSTCVMNARWRLAAYDDHYQEEFIVVKEMLQQFPKNDFLRISVISLMRNQTEREERLRLLKEWTNPPLTWKREDEVHPSLISMLIREYMNDARRHQEIANLMRKVSINSSLSDRTYLLMGDFYWEQRNHELAMECYRFCACLADKQEYASERYFSISQVLNRTEETLAWLHKRFERYGKKSALPAKTLIWGLMRVDRTNEAVDVMRESLKLRPDDGELKLHIGETLLSVSDEYKEEAGQLIDAAESKCARKSWLSIKGYQALRNGDRQKSLEIVRELLLENPLQLNLILNQAVLLQELEGKQAADLYMDEIYQRFPYHFGLMQEYIQWIRERPVEETLAVIRSAIECHPYDAWLYRELGFNLIEVRELYKGLECAELAGKIEPQNTAWMYLKGLILWQMQRDEEAESLLKDALRIDVGNRAAMSLLVKIHDEIEGKRDSLRFVRNELKRQVIQGDAVLTFRLLAEHALPGEELLEELREIHKHRSDLWETYCALGKQLLVVQKMDEAIEILKAGAEKFPLIPRLSLELGQALNLSGQSDAAIQAYQQGLKVNAGYSDIIRQLADIHVKRGENEEAQKLIRSAINQNPRNGINYGWLADLLWEAGQHEDALNEIEKAVELQVDYAWAWGKFQHWCTQEKQPERVLEAARKCTREYPGRVSVWQNLAELLTKDEQREERDAALATALKLDPRDVNLLDDRARYIANEGNYDAAIQICEQAREQGALPSQLKIRLGWIFRKQRKFEEGYAEVMSGLEDDPNHYNAWMMIAEWAREDNRNDLYERASEELVRIEPYSEMSFGHLGEAYERNGKEDQAIKCYERAVEIQPNYIFGLMANFDLELKAKNLAAAQLKWSKLEGVSQTQFVYAREIQLAGLLKDAARVKAAFQKTFVCVNENKEEPEWWPVDIAIQTMREVQLHNDLEQMLRQQMEQHESRIYMQGYLVNKKINDKYNLVDEFKSWISKDQRFRWMVYEWFRILIDSNFKVTFFEFIKKNKKWIISDSLLSAFVCYGVNRYLDFKAGLPFAKVCMMHQDELEPWMLVNISEVFANYADYSRVVDVCTLALEKPKDHHEECIRIMKACSELLLDQKESAHNSLGAINFAGMRSEYALAGLLCRDLIDFEKMSAEEQLQRFKISRQQLGSIIKNYRYLQQEPMRLKLLHRYVNHAIWKQKSLSAKWWGISTKMKLVMGMM